MTAARSAAGKTPPEHPRSAAARQRQQAALQAHATGTPIAAIAADLGVSERTVSLYLDPARQAAYRERQAATKARYRGVCQYPGCEQRTHGRSKAEVPRYCSKHRGEHYRDWDRDQVIAAIRDWRERHGADPRRLDWDRWKAARQGGAALARLDEGRWPSAKTVDRLFGGLAAAIAAADQGVLESDNALR